MQTYACFGVPRLISAAWYTSTHLAALTKRTRYNATQHTRYNTSKGCNLCLWKNYFIVCKPNMANFNRRNELVSTCRHASNMQIPIKKL